MFVLNLGSLPLRERLELIAKCMRDEKNLKTAQVWSAIYDKVMIAGTLEGITRGRYANLLELKRAG